MSVALRVRLVNLSATRNVHAMLISGTHEVAILLTANYGRGPARIPVTGGWMAAGDDNELDRESVYLVGDQAGNIYGLSFVTDADLKATLQRELDAPANADAPRADLTNDPSGVTSLFDPTYMAGCATGLFQAGATDLVEGPELPDEDELAD